MYQYLNPCLHGHSDLGSDPDRLRLHKGILDSNPDSDLLSHVDCDLDSNPDSGPGTHESEAYFTLAAGGLGELKGRLF